MEALRSLYNQVEEKVHTLVMRSNQSLQHLDYLLQLRTMEDKITLVTCFIYKEPLMSLSLTWPR